MVLPGRDEKMKWTALKKGKINMAKMLILNFSAFNSKKLDDKGCPKSYYKFNMYDIERKELHEIFTEQRFCATPGGEVPSQEECRSGFPKAAEVDFTFNQYTDSEGRVRYAPRVNSIDSWKQADLKKLF